MCSKNFETKLNKIDIDILSMHAIYITFVKNHCFHQLISKCK